MTRLTPAAGRKSLPLTPARYAMCAVCALALVTVQGCAAKPVLAANSDHLRVVTTTGLLRDLVQNVGGERIDAVAMVPDSADPHSYEPTLRDTRNVVYADVAFSNYMLLEEHSVIKILDANLRPEAVNVSLAEEAVKYAAEVIPLVENTNLDTIWLGLRAHGDGKQLYGATRASQVSISATALSGPGDVQAYLTGTFGQTEVYFDSSDGFDAANGYKSDTAPLPVNAHTHLSWAFSRPGVYRLTLAARLQVHDAARPLEVDQATFTFAVGMDPTEIPSLGSAGAANSVVADEGHADLTVDLDEGIFEVRYDPSGGGEHTQKTYRPQDIIIEVPTKALAEVPAGPQFSFLGRPGRLVYQLPQAVLGKHVHGEIDPHLWQDVGNAMAYVNLIRDTLMEADPAAAADYRANAAAYLAELESTDDYVRATIAAIPPANRYLVTTHDAFGYLANAYGIKVAGFVTPNPATEPSLTDRRRLSETVRALKVPAVFLEPNLAARSATLTELAAEQGIRICPIYGDTLSGEVTTYVEMMRFNADSLRECLTP